ncbi:cytochrome P460 family protein [Puia dinghuensis]|uniref:Haem-binding domain-containing protein n=1 Tax=Puia dinghuensis TaxID=1792502 RepID=A0A8J2UBS7_9BACT|nr:cytochrome P460 family protein [Puia dinghuensis]GGA95038.1 hypothetical protein GCM10011511_17950 [Puia dinghuensis]
MKPVRPFWKKVRIILLICLAIFIAIQLIRPPLDHPPVTADLQAPPEVKAILKRACYDCHSNETRLAWFDQPAPAYWFVVSDVKEGREALNFSRFDSLPKAQQAAKLFECIMQVEQGGMPLAQYTALHHGRVISAGELAVLKQYALSLGYHPTVDTSRRRAAAEQYAQWVASAGAAKGTGGGGADAAGVKVDAAAVKDEYNGIGYVSLAGFANWRAVSTTERYDNGTLRLILANDVAVKAIREGHGYPWPDGAVFAKVAWDQLPDSSGEIHAGAFKQVEFMVRDHQLFSSSFGWGWARWVGGLALKPYGKDASFVSECVNCHRPLGKTDHTFTFPLADTLSLYDQAAYLPDSVDKHPLMGKVITTMVNPREGTMSTLYGNDLAVKAARSGQASYPGAFYALVTWSQRDDPHWFGGRIPKALVKVETVDYTPGGEVHWSSYQGMPLKKMSGTAMGADRVHYIATLKASVLP